MKQKATMAQVVFWFFLCPTLAFSHLVPISPMPPPRPDCPSMCGSLDIPYPFGIGDSCHWPGEEYGFNLTCNYSYNPPRLYQGDFEIISITLDAGELRVFSSMSSICYNASDSYTGISFKFKFVEPFLISQKRNTFTGIGCDTVALIRGGNGSSSYFSGCISSCKSLHAAAQNGEVCTGLGCCQTSIPTNLNVIDMPWTNKDIPDPTNDAWSYSPCSYAFVSEEGWYHFKRRDLTRVANKSFIDRVGASSIPLVLDWAIRNNGSCRPQQDSIESAKLAPSACVSAHSHCINATQGFGYLCQCSKGYKGNPYIIGGCTNIDECELRILNPAIYEKLYPCHTGSTCHDTQGDYVCKCKFGLRGDGKSYEGCQLIVPEYAIAIVGTFVSSVLACLLLMEVKRRKQKKFFDKNGGEILKGMGINIFTEGQVKKITNRYKTPIGEGAFGKVFMGIINTTERVAVKRSHVKGEAVLQEDFVNEITFQFRISHANLVRLVGCCLETDIPMLVFEFVPNGSLYNVLHGTNKPRSIPLLVRMDIAIGSAEALAYMHSHNGHNHVHGDVKSGNILLDENLTPKVSDFGSSKLVSIAMHANWSVAGDLNYIDPVYIKTGCFTEKSDVYSFGVVLLELITRKTAKYDGCRSLPIDFVSSSKEEGKRRGMYDKDILCEDNVIPYAYMECLDRFGELAVRCLKEDMEDRPTMREVVEELKHLRTVACGGTCPRQASYETSTANISSSAANN